MPSKKEPTEAELTQQAFLTAIAERDAADERLAAETDTLARLTGRLNQGDTSVDLDALGRSRQRVADLKTLAAALERKAAQAKRDRVTDDTGLAEAMVPALQRSLRAPVAVTTSQPERAPAGLPIAVLVQRERHHWDADGGALSGHVALHWIRTHHMLAVDSEKLVRDLHAAGVYVEQVAQSGSRELGPDYVDVIEFKIGQAWPTPGLPVINAGPTLDWRLEWLGASIASAVDTAGFIPGYTAVECKIMSAPAVRSDVTEAGIRTRVIDLQVGSWNKRETPYGASGDHVGLLRGVVSSWNGRCYETLGRCVAAETSNPGPYSIHQGRSVGGSVRAALTFACQVA